MKSKFLNALYLAAFASIALQAGSFAYAAESGTWVDRVTVGGDFRFRHEYIDQDNVDSAEQRQRIRARLKLDGKVNDDVKLVFQFATGTFEAVSTNQTLTDSYSNKHFDLDMAYVDWSVNAGTHFLAGKVKNTLFVPGGSELLWDADLTPEGATVNWRSPMASGPNYFVNLGQYWFQERDAEATTGAHADTLQYSAQVGTETSIKENKLVVGAGYHKFSPIKDHSVPVVGTTQQTKGNSVTGSNYTYGFDLLELFATYDMNLSGRDTQFYVNFVSNSDPSDENKAYLVGVTSGKLKNKGDWTLGYSYRVVEKDALIGAINDGDFANGETDSRGHRLQAQYQIASAVVGVLTYVKSERDVSGLSVATLPKGVNYDRAQIDFMFKF